jgi:membrane protease YdiL (CAAX protease family)
VLLGLVVLLVAAIIEASVVLSISPAPPFQPTAVASVPGDDQERLFVLNADGDSIWVMEPNGDRAIEKVDSIPVGDGMSYLAAGPAPDGNGVLLAAAGRNDQTVQLVEYSNDGGHKRLRRLALNPAGACSGAIRKKRCTGTRSLAIGEVGSGKAPALAVGTLGGQVRIFETGGARQLRLTITLTGNHRIVEAVAVGDVNDDGRGDVLVRAKGGVIPYFADPVGGLRPEPTQRIREIAQALAVGDFGPSRTVAVAPLGSDDAQFFPWEDATGFGSASSADTGGTIRAIAPAKLFDDDTQLAVATSEDHVEVLKADNGDFADDVSTAADYGAQPPLATRLILQALLALTIVIVAFAVANPGGGLARPVALGMRRPIRPWIRPSIAAYLTYVGCAIAITALLHPQQEDITRDLGFGESVLGGLASAFLVVVVAPFSEEIFFRGFMFTGLRRRLPFIVAAVISAAIWGLFHFTGPGSWGVVLQLSVFGVILAWLYQRTGSIWPTIAVHALNNLLAFALLTS